MRVEYVSSEFSRQDEFYVFTLYTFKKSIYYDVIFDSNILDNFDAPDMVYDGL